MVDLDFFSIYLRRLFYPVTYLIATKNLVYPVNCYLHYTNIVSKQKKDNIPCIFCFIYINKIMLFTECCMGARSNQNICAITTQI